MMENKFRVWDNLNKRMIYPADKRNDTCLVFEEGGWFIADHLMGESPITISTSEEDILMQRVGTLKDKNGKDSYVGDIYKETRYDGSVRFYRIFEVIGGFAINQFQDDFYKTNELCFYAGLSEMQTTSFFEGNLELIGNIYENPELLIKS